MADMTPVRTPYYLRPMGLQPVVNGYLYPAALRPSDDTAEIAVTGPSSPRLTLTRIGIFTYWVEYTLEAIPLSLHGIEHVSVWASSDEGARDASFRVMISRNGAILQNMYTDTVDLDSSPKELTVSDLPPIMEPVLFYPGDEMQVEIQYTAASRFGTGPAPDCVFYANSLEFPSRVELEVVPMEVEVTIPQVGSDVIQVRGRVMDTSQVDCPDEMGFYLEISSLRKGSVASDTIMLKEIDDDYGEIVIDWAWYYRRADPFDDMYEFQVSASYQVEGIFYTSSIQLALIFDEDGAAHIATEIDSDGDGYCDDLDAFPDDPTEWADSDGDGHGDNSDDFPHDATEWEDTDGDGYGDNMDQFPDDATEWKDSDDDGRGDNADAFPHDDTEWSDTDDDGYGDNGDAFPYDSLEWTDSDGDGHGDNGDAFPYNRLEWTDSDSDGHGDNGDAFPSDSLEWTDADGDGHGDNGDAFPNDKDEWTDTDMDGVGDNGDAFPQDAAASVDTDGDGYPDSWNPGKTKADSTTGLEIDKYPKDASKWKEDDSPGFGAIVSTIALATLVFLSAIGRGRRRRPSLATTRGGFV